MNAGAGTQEVGTRRGPWTKKLQHTLFSAITECFSRCRDRIQSFMNPDHGWYYEQPFAWMEEYNRALLEPDPTRAETRTRQALRAVAQRKCALEEKGAGCPEWNLLQYAELVLRRIGKERALVGRQRARRESESGLLQTRKAA